VNEACAKLHASVATDRDPGVTGDERPVWLRGSSRCGENQSQ